MPITELVVSTTEPVLLPDPTIEVSVAQSYSERQRQKAITSQKLAVSGEKLNQTGNEKKIRQQSKDVGKQTLNKLESSKTALRASLTTSGTVVANIGSTVSNNPSGGSLMAGTTVPVDVSGTGVQDRSALERLITYEVHIGGVRYDKAQQEFDVAAADYIESEATLKAIEEA